MQCSIEHLVLIFNPLHAFSILVGLVGELLSSTSTRYAESTAAPSPQPSPPHSTQWFNYYFTPCTFTELVLIAQLHVKYKCFMCAFMSVDIIMFSGNILSSSYSLVWVWSQLWTHLYLSKPSRHWPLSALSQPASINTPWWACFFQSVITRVLLLQEEGEAFSKEKKSIASESSSKPVTCIIIYQCMHVLVYWIFRQISAFFTCRISGGVVVIHLHTLCWVQSCNVSSSLFTELHTVSIYS